MLGTLTLLPCPAKFGFGLQTPDRRGMGWPVLICTMCLDHLKSSLSEHSGPDAGSAEYTVRRNESRVPWGQDHAEISDQFHSGDNLASLQAFRALVLTGKPCLCLGQKIAHFEPDKGGWPQSISMPILDQWIRWMYTFDYACTKQTLPEQSEPGGLDVPQKSRVQPKCLCPLCLALSPPRHRSPLSGVCHKDEALQKHRCKPWIFWLQKLRFHPFALPKHAHAVQIPWRKTAATTGQHLEWNGKPWEYMFHWIWSVQPKLTVIPLASFVRCTNRWKPNGHVQWMYESIDHPIHSLSYPVLRLQDSVGKDPPRSWEIGSQISCAQWFNKFRTFWASNLIVQGDDIHHSSRTDAKWLYTNKICIIWA